MLSAPPLHALAHAASPSSTIPTAPQHSLTTARNVQNVVLGDILFKTWYPSFYPEELVGRETERLY
ncbi:MAG: hypothetical protein M1830_010591, partial [Pleopsidium flavum]